MKIYFSVLVLFLVALGCAIPLLSNDHLEERHDFQDPPLSGSGTLFVFYTEIQRDCAYWSNGERRDGKLITCNIHFFGNCDYDHRCR